MNSLHGQGILDPGQRVVIEGIAEDGTIEAIRIADAPGFALGVQWHVGGISPFGQKKRVPTAIEQASLREASVFINGGQRGLQIQIDPNAACEALSAIVADVVA